jgi:hypothetical protein
VLWRAHDGALFREPQLDGGDVLISAGGRGIGRSR